MTKLELIKEMLDWAETAGYNRGVDRGHEIAKARYVEALKQEFRKGQIFEAKRIGDTKRLLELNGGINE